MQGKKPRRYIVTFINGRQISLVNIKSYQRLQQGEIQCYGHDGEKSDYLSGVQSFIEAD